MTRYDGGMVFRVVNVGPYRLGQAQLPTAPETAPTAPSEAISVVPAAPEPKPRWVTAGSKDLLPTLAAVGTVAALAIAGVTLLK